MATIIFLFNTYVLSISYVPDSELSKKCNNEQFKHILGLIKFVF